ncbi:aromatic prenyltransferase [Laetiporus sulphureus 93-53]|uniref:Aromatic prenyltransferase n=1 Tax=Laetiporus sulphureus 93-53 TaxID=1314785 RepID=A0A165B6V0_9APHY|nr:aromatic prenyltransferase [Laetiporus sulphureus 93-53]KZT00378.1 aromatic prenyltransferase [Laetiporus sulphureus 93-53]
MLSVLTLRAQQPQVRWETTGEVLMRLLEMAAYSEDIKDAYEAFYYAFILPELGEGRDPHAPPSVHHESFHLTVCSQSLPKAYSLSYPDTLPLDARCGSPNALTKHVPQFVSFMTDDHTPLEFSCVFDVDGRATIRFSIDPIERQREGGEPAMKVFEHYASILGISDADLAWCRVCAANLTMVTDAGPLKIYGRPRYPSQYFVGFELTGATPSMKAYFLPETISAATGISKYELVEATIRELAQDAKGLLLAWSAINSFFCALPDDLKPSPEIVAVDCCPSHRNRVKVYVRTPKVTLDIIRRFMTLDYTLKTPALEQALSSIAIFWDILFPGLPVDKEPELSKQHTEHLTGGLLFYYELRGNSCNPYPKVYIPVRHLCKNDEQIVEAMEQFYRAIGNLETTKKYHKIVRNTFTHRPLMSRTGIHTYIAVAAKADSIETTAYFNPERHHEWAA